MTDLIWLLLGAYILPLWLASGLLDYATHRKLRAELGYGVTESVLHLLQVVQIGALTLLLLLCTVNALVLLLVALLVLAHTATAYADLVYAALRRAIRPSEQFAHAFLSALPFAVLALVALLYAGAQPAAQWVLYAREPALPARVIALVLVASVVCAVLPGVAELLRVLPVAATVRRRQRARAQERAA